MLSDGVTYTHVLAMGTAHTVLLKSDGSPVLFGFDKGDCNFPVLPEGVAYVGSGEHTLLTMNLCDANASFVFACGREVCKVEIDASDAVADVRNAFMKEMNADH